MMPEIWAEQPRTDSDCKWQTVSPNTVGNVSATAYFYARALNASLQHSYRYHCGLQGWLKNRGWLNKENIKTYKDPRPGVSKEEIQR